MLRLFTKQQLSSLLGLYQNVYTKQHLPKALVLIRTSSIQAHGNQAQYTGSVERGPNCSGLFWRLKILIVAFASTTQEIAQLHSHSLQHFFISEKKNSESSIDHGRDQITNESEHIPVQSVQAHHTPLVTQAHGPRGLQPCILICMC